MVRNLSSVGHHDGTMSAVHESSDAPRLSVTSFVVLGMIALRGDSTPYDLKRAMARSIAYFWAFPHTQLYQEPARLAELGLLSVDDEQGGRRRKTYALTTAGREALLRWMRTPVDSVFEMRDEAVLQLFFSEMISTEELSSIARHQVELYEGRLAEYALIAKANATRMHGGRRMIPLELGVRMATVVRDYWQEIADEPPVA